MIITTISLIIYTYNNQTNEKQDQTLEASSSPEIINKDIFVDVSGAVKKPDIYKISFGGRIKNVIDLAGGLSEEADELFFYRNFNLARIVVDQEKIYIPSLSEINNGIFSQSQFTLDYNSPVTNITTPPASNDQLISLNYASIEELDQLPGIGQVTANKIILNRPYATLEDLLTKKVINKGVFEKIKDLVSLN